MPRSNKIYSMKEFSQVAINPETTAMTANTTAMKLIPTSGDVSVTENVFRRQDVQAGIGRTPKSADVKVVTTGTIKTISVPFYLEETIVKGLLENGAGKVSEVGGDLQIAFNHSPAEVGLGGTFTDWTGTVTLAMINPEAGKSEVWAGCVVNTLTISATKGTDSGLFACTAEFLTQSEVLEQQATPTGLVAYTLSDLNIGDFCDTSQINSNDVTINAFSTTYNFNQKMVGVCSDGNAISIAKNVGGLIVDHTIVYAVDENTASDSELGRSATAFPISMSDGSNLKITSLLCNPTADISKSSVEDMAFWTLNARAFAGTSGNMHEVEIAS